MPDIAVFEMMLENNPNCGLPLKSVQAQCDELAEEICDLLREVGRQKNAKPGEKYSEESLRLYRRNTLAFFSREQLRQRLADIKETQRLYKLTPEAIKAEEQAKNKATSQTQLPLDVTKEKLLASVGVMRFWLRWESMDPRRRNAVNNRLNGRG